MISERTQKKLFDKIASQYEVQYNEKYSQQYRRKRLMACILLTGGAGFIGYMGIGSDPTPKN